MKLIFLVVLIVVTAVLQWWSGRRNLENLEVGQSLSALCVEPDDEFEIILTFTNKGWLFIPFLRYQVYVPEEFDIHLDTKQIYLNGKGQRYATGTTWLGPHQRLEKRIPVSVSKRGCYLLRELVIYGGDFLGINEQPHSFGKLCEVVVYPKPASGQDISQVFGGFLGDVSVRRFIQEDPVLTLGYREYTGREPMKTISWTQSARRGELMVKKFDYTLEPSVSVILNVEGGAAQDMDEKIETCLSLARSVCAELEEKEIKYDFRMNPLTIGSVALSDYFNEGLGSGHYYGILESLGRAVHQAKIPCFAMLDQAGRSMTSSHGIVFITPGDLPGEKTYVEKFAGQNGGTLLVITAREAKKC